MNHNSKWDKRDEWIRMGKNFCVTVYHWRFQLPDDIKSQLGRDGNNWNVYVYIFPDHPLFDKLTENQYEYDEPFDLLHGGCTYIDWNYDSEGNVTRKKYGSDYMHAYDDRYSRMSTEEEAHDVFDDADALYKAMEEMVNESRNNKNRNVCKTRWQPA